MPSILLMVVYFVEVLILIKLLFNLLITLKSIVFYQLALQINGLLVKVLIHLHLILVWAMILYLMLWHVYILTVLLGLVLLILLPWLILMLVLMFLLVLEVKVHSNLFIRFPTVEELKLGSVLKVIVELTCGGWGKLPVVVYLIVLV